MDIKEKDLQVLAVHKVLEENFTSMELRIMLVSALEKINSADYIEIGKTLDRYHDYFSKNKFDESMKNTVRSTVIKI